MASFHVIGNSLIEPEELLNKHYTGEISSLRNINLKSSKHTLRFLSSSHPVNLLEDKHTQLREDFTPIGIGKPLSIEIATVYTGHYKKFLGWKKDVIVLSGVKDSQTFAATSRAINIKADKVNENDFLKFTAFADGTKFVYYSPAMDTDSMDVSFEIMFDNFDTSLFETIGALLTSAAGLPVFMPAAGYLLGGSQLINIGSRLGDTLFSGSPNLSGTIPIQFQSPVIPPTEPREFVIYNDSDKAEFEKLKVGLNAGGTELRLVNISDGKEYNGDAPYMIVILDGAKRENLDSFAPTIASASILKKFYGASDRTGEVTSILQDAMKLYNDSTYKTKGEKVKRQMDEIANKDSEEFKKLKTLYDAYSANIQSDNFKLPSI